MTLDTLLSAIVDDEVEAVRLRPATPPRASARRRRASRRGSPASAVRWRYAAAPRGGRAPAARRRSADRGWSRPERRESTWSHRPPLRVRCAAEGKDVEPVQPEIGD